MYMIKKHVAALCKAAGIEAKTVAELFPGKLALRVEGLPEESLMNRLERLSVKFIITDHGAYELSGGKLAQMEG